MPLRPHVTELLGQWKNGDRRAVSEIFRLVYRELRAIAGNMMRNERQGHVLQATALVDEAYIRLFGGAPASLEASTQFYRLAARVMRNILIEEARKRNAQKREGFNVTLKDDHVASPANADRTALLCLAIRRLAKHDARGAQIVELYYFAGRETAEIAAMLDLDKRTVQRDLAASKLWLNRELQGISSDTGTMGQS